MFGDIFSLWRRFSTFSSLKKFSKYSLKTYFITWLPFTLPSPLPDALEDFSNQIQLLLDTHINTFFLKHIRRSDVTRFYWKIFPLKFNYFLTPMLTRFFLNIYEGIFSLSVTYITFKRHVHHI